MRLKSRKDDKPEWALLKKVLSEFGVQGSDKFYVKSGNLLQLVDTTNIKQRSSHAPVIFKTQQGGTLPRRPEPGDVFLVLRYALAYHRRDELHITLLWKEKVVVAFLNLRDFSIRDVFSLVGHASDE